jgi:hypothetical protein
MPFDFIYPELRINPEYKFDEILSGYNYNFVLLSGGTTGSSFTGGTVDNITVTGSTSVTSISADTIYSGSTNLYDIFLTSAGVTNIGSSDLTITDATRSLLFGASTTEFAIRNSGDTVNMFEIDNIGNTYVRNTSNAHLEVLANNTSYFLFQEGGYNTALATPATFTQYNGSHRYKLALVSGNAASKIEMQQGNYGFGTSWGTGTNFTESGVINIVNGIAPTSGPGNGFKIYSDDVVAGNAAPHFITEGGDIIKLYTESAVTTSQGIADALTSLGLLTASTIVDSGDITRVQPGTNIATGGTDNLPVINLENDIILNSATLSALTVNGQSVFSGDTDVVTIYGSGDTSPVFSVQGSAGELFAVTDSLTGSLFSVNDISGLPILEVFDDDTILMGSYAAPSLNTTAKVTANSGQTTVYSIPASAYTGAFFDYTVVNAIGARSGNVMAIWSGTSNIEFSETSTTDIGNSSDLTFDVAISGTDVLFRASANTDSWTVKSIVRSI